LTSDGRFVIAQEEGGTQANPNSERRIYLERCGTKQRTLIDPFGMPPAANPLGVLWNLNGYSSELDGVFLPSLRRFKLRAPAGYVTAVLSSRRLFVTAGYPQRLWSAPAPTPPR
jgi:hypothetical protein